MYIYLVCFFAFILLIFIFFITSHLDMIQCSPVGTARFFFPGDEEGHEEGDGQEGDEEGHEEEVSAFRAGQLGREEDARSDQLASRGYARGGHDVSLQSRKFAGKTCIASLLDHLNFTADVQISSAQLRL